MTGPFQDHAQRDFDSDMRALRDDFASMAARCSEQVHRALEAFWTGSTAKAAEVEARDAVIDADEKALDASALRVLALRQPVAADLRALTAVFKLVTDLERIGDEAVDIARSSAPSSADADVIRAPLRKMADLSEGMVQSAVAAFLEGDAAKAEQVLRVNGIVDMLHDEILADVIPFIAKHAVDMPAAIASMEVAKGLRRIAEHAKNIADGALFVARGAAMPR